MSPWCSRYIADSLYNQHRISCRVCFALKMPGPGKDGKIEYQYTPRNHCIRSNGRIIDIYYNNTYFH
jgi:hypothetical protein